MPNSPRTLLEAIVRMFVTGDASTANSLFSVTYLDHQGLGEGELIGPDEFRRMVAVARSRYDQLDVGIEDVLLDGDKVAARLRWIGTRRGRTVERETIEILRIQDGRAVEHWGARLWMSER